MLADQHGRTNKCLVVAPEERRPRQYIDSSISRQLWQCLVSSECNRSPWVAHPWVISYCMLRTVYPPVPLLRLVLHCL